MSAVSEKFEESSQKFTNELFSTIAQDDSSKNIIISPISVQTCVAMAYAGATGSTAKEMEGGLHLVSDDNEKVAQSYSMFLESYEFHPQVKMANKIYVNQNYKLKPAFREITKNHFRSEADTINVASPAEAADKVNNWVKEKTNDKIKDLFSPDNIDDYTRLILVNAIYFKGNWAKKFEKDSTFKDSFFYNENDSTEVDMMSQTSEFRYGEIHDLDACVLELPYADSDLSMLIVLPNSITGLKGVESKLKNMTIVDINQKLFKKKVKVMLPKFKVEYFIELNEPLKKLGMKRMFSNEAEFENMLEEPEPLKVSKVLHKAFIEVNEEGTEAAAATGMVMMMRCSFVPSQPEFIVNHPFYYVIWDQKKILFAGRNIKL